MFESLVSLPDEFLDCSRTQRWRELIRKSFNDQVSTNETALVANTYAGASGFFPEPFGAAKSRTRTCSSSCGVLCAKAGELLENMKAE